MKKTLVLFLFSVLIDDVYSQVTTAQDCSVAVVVCTNSSFSVQTSGSGFVDFTTSSTLSNPTSSPPGVIPAGGMGCMMAGELNPTWMIIAVQSAGMLEFSMGAGSGPGAQGGCYDWIMWPYTSNTCSGINGNSQAPVRCCWNSFCSGGTGLASPANLPAGAHQQDFGAPLNVNCGDKFIICFSNYSSVTTLVPLNFFGSAIVSCTSSASAPVISVSGNTMICAGQTTTLTASGTPTYTWSTGVNTNTAVVSPSVTSTYTVSGDNGVCIGQTAVTVSVSSCTGVQNIDQPLALRLIPNPGNGNFRILADKNFSGQLIISDISGRTLFERKLAETGEVIYTSLPEGLYIYRIISEQSSTTGKIVIESSKY